MFLRMKCSGPGVEVDTVSPAVRPCLDQQADAFLSSPVPPWGVFGKGQTATNVLAPLNAASRTR